MTPRNFLFSLKQQTPEVKYFNNILLYCQEFVEKNLPHLFAEEEPNNEPVTPPPPAAKKSGKTTLPSSLPYLISQGIKILGITSLAHAAKADDLSIVKGYPNGTWSPSYCGGHDVYKCVEAYVANGSDAVMRFTLQSYAANANLDFSDTLIINDCVAGNYDPLIELIRDITKDPKWYTFPGDPWGGFEFCPKRFKYDLNVIVDGSSRGLKINGTDVLITGSTYDAWSEGVDAIGKRCTSSLENERLKIFTLILVSIVVGPALCCGGLKLLHDKLMERRQIADRAEENGLRQVLASAS